MANRSLSIAIPEEWHQQLEKIARHRSFKENKNINRLDLIREALIEKYSLKYGTKEKQNGEQNL